MATSAPPNDLDLLDHEHREGFCQALTNVLATDVAEFTYAQILDGLPTEKSLKDSYWTLEEHPVFQLEHKELCSGFLDKARVFRANFDPSDLDIEQEVLLSYQGTIPGTKQFYLRLIELVVIACHQIAAYLFELDDGAHKHQLHQEWREKQLQDLVDGAIRKPRYLIPPTAFFHSEYYYPEQYPRGVADIVGYWAEGRIFGGVVVFDRGETEKECKAMWIHGALFRGPQTLYPPTDDQFDALVTFLLASSEDVTCPLPIHGERLNRPRWDPWDALVNFHIFRDKYERKISPTRPSQHCVQRFQDWPEIEDQYFLIEQARAHHRGLLVDEEGAAAAQARLNEVTPSSPCWSFSNKRF